MRRYPRHVCGVACLLFIVSKHRKNGWWLDQDDGHTFHVCGAVHQLVILFEKYGSENGWLDRKQQRSYTYLHCGSPALQISETHDVRRMAGLKPIDHEVISEALRRVCTSSFFEEIQWWHDGRIKILQSDIHHVCGVARLLPIISKSNNPSRMAGLKENRILPMCSGFFHVHWTLSKFLKRQVMAGSKDPCLQPMAEAYFFSSHDYDPGGALKTSYSIESWC